MQDATSGRRVEYLIDASGVGSLFREIPGIVRKQATVLLYGHGHAGVDLSVLNNVQFLEPTLVSPVGASGGFLADGRPATYRRALDLIATGQVQTSRRSSRTATRRSTRCRTPSPARHRAPDYVKGIVEL